MWFSYILAFLLAIWGATWYHNETVKTHELSQAYAIDTGRNMGVYATYALKAYDNNLTYTGVIPAGSMNLPSWYVPLPGLTAYVNGGHLYVYITEPNATQAGIVLRQLATQQSRTATSVGMDIGGTIYSPANVALIAAPVGMPNYSVVLIVV